MVEKTHPTSFWPQMFEPFARAGSRIADWLTPASDASSDDNAYRISIELPGVAQEDVSLEMHNGMLTLKGQKKTEREEKGETWYFSERQYGSFSRSFRLPADADADGVAAELKDGVLSVVVPRVSPQKVGAKRVEIST